MPTASSELMSGKSGRVGTPCTKFHLNRFRLEKEINGQLQNNENNLSSRLINGRKVRKTLFTSDH